MEYKQDHWFQSALLFGILALMVFFYTRAPEQKAHAAGGGWDTNGIMAIITKPTQRMVLVDTNKQNICVYRIRGTGDFRLTGARSYKYDVELKTTKGSLVERGNGITFFQAKQIYDQLEKNR